MVGRLRTSELAAFGLGVVAVGLALHPWLTFLALDEWIYPYLYMGTGLALVADRRLSPGFAPRRAWRVVALVVAGSIPLSALDVLVPAYGYAVETRHGFEMFGFIVDSSVELAGLGLLPVAQLVLACGYFLLVTARGTSERGIVLPVFAVVVFYFGWLSPNYGFHFRDWGLLPAMTLTVAFSIPAVGMLVVGSLYRREDGERTPPSGSENERGTGVDDAPD